MHGLFHLEYFYSEVLSGSHLVNDAHAKPPAIEIAQPDQVARERTILVVSDLGLQQNNLNQSHQCQQSEDQTKIALSGLSEW